MQFPDYSFDPHYAVTNGQRMHYLDEGDSAADPLVMVHGNPSWSYYYRKLVLALSDKYRCIVPDHIGMGLSDKPAEADYRFTLEQRIDDLEALLEQLGLGDNITLIVHDWGGMIGMGYAARHPDRIKRLVILNTGAFHLPAGKSLPWQIRLSRIPAIGALLNQGLNAFSKGAVTQCVTRQPMPAAVGAAYTAPYNSWHNRLAVRKFVEDIPLSRHEQAYDIVTGVQQSLVKFAAVPMLICWGMKDFVFDHHFLREWQDYFPQAEVHRYEDAGHYILEDAANEVIPEIRAFLEKHSIQT